MIAVRFIDWMVHQNSLHRIRRIVIILIDKSSHWTYQGKMYPLNSWEENLKVLSSLCSKKGDIKERYQMLEDILSEMKRTNVMLLTYEKFQNTKYVKKWNWEHLIKWEKTTSILLFIDRCNVHVPLWGGNLQ